MIYLLYGQPASGKTTLGRILAAHLLTSFYIDGDEFRDFFLNKKYDRIGREENIRNANAVATYLNKSQKQDVVLSFVNPYEYLRRELRTNNGNEVLEIYLHSTRELRKSYHVEDFEAGTPDLSLNTDEETKITWEKLFNFITK